MERMPVDPNPQNRKTTDEFPRPQEHYLEVGSRLPYVPAPFRWFYGCSLRHARLRWLSSNPVVWHHLIKL